MTGAGITPKCYPALPSPGGKILDWEHTEHSRVRQEYKRDFPPFVEVEIETNRKNHQPRESCNYSVISYSGKEITHWHGANRRVSAVRGAQIKVGRFGC